MTPWVMFSGKWRSVVVPSPSCPLKFHPQHSSSGCCEPCALIAHVWNDPALTSVQSSDEEMRTGCGRSVVVPSPTWP